MGFKELDLSFLIPVLPKICAIVLHVLLLFHVQRRVCVDFTLFLLGYCNFDVTSGFPKRFLTLVIIFLKLSSSNSITSSLGAFNFFFHCKSYED